jgi:hypothetical protein
MKTAALIAAAALCLVDPAAATAGTLVDATGFGMLGTAGAVSEAADARIALCIMEWAAPLAAIPVTLGAFLASVRV